METAVPWRTSIFGREAEYTRYLLTACGSGGRELASTSPLTAAEAGGWYDLMSRHAGVAGVIAMERSTRASETWVALDSLPGPGEATSLPELPEGFSLAERHYRLADDPDGLPLATGDQVRRRSAQLASEGRHPAARGSLLRVAAYGLLEVSHLHADRRINRSDLPN